MRRTGLVLAWLLVLAHAPPLAARCFDLGHKIEHGMTIPKPLGPGPVADIEEAMGEYATGIVWAAVRGEVARGVDELVAELQKQDVRRGPDAEMRIAKVDDPVHLIHEDVHFAIKPVPLITIEWTETWVFDSVAATDSAPARVVAVYEKTSGTSYIAHMCGSVTLKRRSDTETDVIMYEEIKASHRPVQSVANGIRATLQGLRRGAADAKQAPKQQ